MSPAASLGAGATWLAVDHDGPEQPRWLVAMVTDVGGRARQIHLPHFGRTVYRIDVSASAAIAFADGFRAASVPPVSMLRTTTRLSAFGAQAVLPGITVTPVAYRGGVANSPTHNFMREVRMMARMNLLADPAPAPRHTPATALSRRGSARVALVVHLHYPEVWPELAEACANAGSAADLLVSLTPAAASAAPAIRARFPHAEIRAVENRGYDVAPFLEWLGDGALDAYDLVCKVHGKKSAYSDGVPSLIGETWRRALLAALLGSEAHVGEIVARFEHDATLGIVGPETLHLRDDSWRRFVRMKENRALMIALARRMNVPWYRLPLDFFAGSMFWARPAALRPLARLGLRMADFPPVAGEQDGTLAHAVERMFNLAALEAGYRVAGVAGESAEPVALAA